ncbi:MAG: SIMPL domain-containing protein [Gemmatimonadetes bacterium]|nr:SIMPL domain-containing protein [Gemmatimonadota bacterium]NNM04131.1 SIMPL domain-containing protein [Gemmatimonadota bacterium]
MKITERSCLLTHAWALLLAPFLLLSSCTPAIAQPAPSPRQLAPQEEGGTIQVTGQAQITVPADRVLISFIVETEGATAGEATETNAGQMEDVISAVRGAGISGLEIDTYGYTLRPEYQVSRDGSGTRSISGYRAQNNIRVTVPDIDATGHILDRAVEAGANRVANLQFEASDTRQARLEALREAVAGAREQAETIASAMGVRLGIAVEVQGGATAPSPRSPGGMMLRASAEATTPVEAGEHLVSASVSIRYRILEGGS